MPIYNLKNKKTGEVKEMFCSYDQKQKFLQENPEWISEISAPSFRLEGSGWYETDFKTGNKKNIAKSDNETQSSPKPKEKKESPTKKVPSEKK